MPVSADRLRQASMRRCVTIHMFLTATVIIATVLALISMALSGRAENLGPTITLPLWNQLDSTDKPALSSCHAEEHAEYFATSVVLWGSQNKKESAQHCCDQCFGTEGCNVWVFCPSSSGCGVDRVAGECWLKTDSNLEPREPMGKRGPDVLWVSGLSLSVEERESIVAQKEVHATATAERRTTLRGNTSMPLVFLDVSIKDHPLGRMEFVLFTGESPRAAENFRQLCTGEAGIVPPGRHGAGKAYHFKGSHFYRIIHNFIDQSGADVESVFGGQFDDDPGGLALKHDRFGLLSMANAGPNTNTAHFSIVVAPAPHLDGHYTIFGELVSGEDVAMAINKVSMGKPDNTAGKEEEVIITDSGQIR